MEANTIVIRSLSELTAIDLHNPLTVHTARICTISCQKNRNDPLSARSNTSEDEDVGDKENGSQYLASNNILADGEDFLEQLSVVESKRVVYKTVSLRNGNQLRLNRQIRWLDQEGKSLKIGPDLSAYFSNEMLNWAGELKGGADPAGSDEHWKTATRAFDRILGAAEDTGKPRPKLSFIATILVDRVAREAALWIEQGKLTSVYNLTQIAEDSAKREAFLNDLAKFLGCEI